MSKQNDLLRKSTAGVSFLVIGQIVTKLFTFLLNQLLIRFISPKVFGISSYFEVILSTALFFSREGVRLSIQRIESTEAEDDNGKTSKSGKESKTVYVEGTKVGTLQSVINFGYIAVLAGLPISILISFWQSKSSIFTDKIVLLPLYKQSIGLVWLSLVLELCAEPLYVLNQVQLNFSRRTKFESLATFARCTSTFLVVFISNKLYSHSKADFKDGIAVLAFAIGQFFYSFTIFSTYQLSFQTSDEPDVKKCSLGIQKIMQLNAKSWYYFNPKIFVIWKSIFIQMLFKQILTEGDKLLINYVCSLEEQGVYSVVTNYGSLIARLLFQPIEESLRLYLTRLLSTPSQENVATSKSIMSYLSVFYISFSLLICIAGYTNGSFLLQFILGRRASANWVSTDLFSVFPQYLLYIPFLAFNGILESFFNSVASKENISSHSIFMSISTVVFLSASFVLIDYLKLGLSGLILANTINMTIRILYCGNFIASYFAKWNQEIHFQTVATKLFTPVCIATGIEFIQYKLLHDKFMTTTFADFFKSIGICITFLLSALYLERSLVTSSIKSLLNKRKSKAE